MQYYLQSLLRGCLLGGLVLLFSCSWLKGEPLKVIVADTIVKSDDYKLIIQPEKDQTEVTLIDYNERHKVRRLETTAYQMEEELREKLPRIFSTFGFVDGNSYHWGTIRLLPKLYFGSVVMLGDAFPNASTPCFNHYLVAPIGYRFYIQNRFFVGFDFAFEGRTYSLRDGYYFTTNKELNELSQSRYDESIGLRQSKLVTRYISLPISLGILPLRSSRMRMGVEVIPQFKYREYVMHKKYGNRHKEQTKTLATPPLSLTYGVFVDFRPIGLYVHYTPQTLLLTYDSMSGYYNKGLLTAGLSITF